MYFYIYGNNFSGCQTYFYNDWSGLANSFNFFSELGAKYVFVESARGHYSPMSSFRVYLKSRLGWDGASDFNKVADEFFPAYYGPASEELREYFERNASTEYEFHIEPSIPLEQYKLKEITINIFQNIQFLYLPPTSSKCKPSHVAAS